MKKLIALFRLLVPFAVGEPVALGDFEHKTLAAIDQLRNGAYGAQIAAFLREFDGKSAPLSQVYVSLNRLERKGLIAAAEIEAEGGRRIPYALTAVGQRALQESRAAHAQLAVFPNKLADLAPGQPA